MNSNMVKLSNNELDNISGGKVTDCLPTWEDVKASWHPAFGVDGMIRTKFLPKFWETAGAAIWGSAILVLKKGLDIFEENVRKARKARKASK